MSGSAFAELGLHPALITNITSPSPPNPPYSIPTGVQAEAIPGILGGADVAISAPTGSGKTASFCLPILQLVLEEFDGISDPSTNLPSQRVGLFNGQSDSPLTTKQDRNDTVYQADTPHWLAARASFSLTPTCPIIIGYTPISVNKGFCRVGFGAPAASLALGTTSSSAAFGSTGVWVTNNTFTKVPRSAPPPHLAVLLCLYPDGSVALAHGETLVGVVGSVRGVCTPHAVPHLYLKQATVRCLSSHSKQGHPFGPTARWWDELPASDRHPLGARSPRLPNQPFALIVAPVKDLVTQIASELRRMSVGLPHVPIVESLVGGGRPLDPAAARDLLVVTPGKLEALLRSHASLLAACRVVVLDEADALEASARRPIERAVQAVTDRPQVLLLSATLHTPGMRRFIANLTQHPMYVDHKGPDALPDNVDHAVVPLSTDILTEYGDLTVATDGLADPTGLKRARWLTVLKVLEVNKVPTCMIFVRTKEDADNLTALLTSRQLPAAAFHGGMATADRAATLAAFASPDDPLRLLVCTDAAARGIDTPPFPLVISANLPDTVDVYVHRSGRVGRGAAVGLSLSLVAPTVEQAWYHRCKGAAAKTCRAVGKCTTTLDDQQTWRAIADRVQVPVLSLDSTLALALAGYGRKRKADGAGADAPGATKVRAHLARTLSSARAVAQRERTLQRSFLARMYR